MASISVTPQSCLMDESVTVKVTGLEKASVYTLHTTASDCKGVPFFTVATYKSDDAGEIDLTKSPALGGHFRGVLPMAPFAHLLPVEQKALFPRFDYSDVTKPVQFTLSVYAGPVAVQVIIPRAALGLKPVCSVQHERRLMAEGCQRIPVRDGKVRGTLFLPPGEGPFPGVVDMFGGAGGLMEHRAALFASRGFATLALAYFAYEDLQESMQAGFDIAYFDEAVQYLLSRAEVRKVGVGVIGSSKGGDLALSMATNIPQIKAAVVVNGGIYSAVGAFKLLDGTHRAVVPLAFERLVLHRDGVMETYHAMCDPSDHPDAIIPVEDAYGDILWLSGLADRAMNTEMFARLAVERCTERGKPDKVKVLKYPGAGHLLEPPNIPFSSITLQELMKIGTLNGGNAEEHCAAQEDAWKQVLAFFNDKLQ